jgi:hypothetical protein
VQEVSGFQSKREAAAEKLQEPVNLLEARRIADEYGTPDSQVDSGNLYFALRKCLNHIDAQPAQEPVACVMGTYGGMFVVGPLNAAMVLPVGMALYAGPQREWVGLTDEEIHGTPWYNETRETYQFALALIAKLKERNS